MLVNTVIVKQVMLFSTEIVQTAAFSHHLVICTFVYACMEDIYHDCIFKWKDADYLVVFSTPV